MFARQDGKQAIRKIIQQLKARYGLTAGDVSGILGELLAESRDEEITDVMLGLTAKSEEEV